MELSAEQRELIQKAKAGDPAAQDCLARDWRKWIYAVCYDILKHHEDANDVCQKAVVLMVSHIETLRDVDLFPAWIGTLTRRVCTNHLKAKKEELSLDARSDGGGAAVGEPVDHRRSVEEMVEIKLQLEAILQEIEKLPDASHRRVIKLAAIGETDAEISGQVDKKTSTVRGILHRFRKRLSGED